MSQEMKSTLQSILNSIEKPAFLRHHNKIELVNELFLSQGYTTQNYLDKSKEAGCYIEEKDINNDMKICEIKNCDLQLLKQSQQKLTKAMALL